jgi:hypothetical protein
MPDEDAQHKANIKAALCRMILPGVCHAHEKRQIKEILKLTEFCLLKSLRSTPARFCLG